MAKILDTELSSLEAAVCFLKAGGLVSFPTETVYGLGANAYNSEAIKQIYKIKKRPPINPLIAHYHSPEEALNRDVITNDIAEALAATFWPGPMTLVLNRKTKSKISEIATAGLSTLAVRVPDHKTCQQLLSKLDFPLVAPSANKSTTLSTTSAEAVAENFSDYDDLLIIDGGECSIGLESTIIDVSSGEYSVILRYGAITPEQISRICPIRTASAIISNKPIAPGMMFKHYSPQRDILINQDNCSNIDSFLDYNQQNKRLKNKAVAYLDLSMNGNLNEAAANLFKMLRLLDHTQCERIAVAEIPNIGIGIAINDKLKRAAGMVDKKSITTSTEKLQYKKDKSAT